MKNPSTKRKRRWVLRATLWDGLPFAGFSAAVAHFKQSIAKKEREFDFMNSVNPA
jgi:hypothetical protein